MNEVAAMEPSTGGDGGGGAADGDAIHGDEVARGEITRGEFVFSGDGLAKGPGERVERDGGACAEVFEGNNGVVGRVDAENGLGHGRISGGLEREPAPKVIQSGFCVDVQGKLGD